MALKRMGGTGQPMQMAVFHLYYVSRRIPQAWQLGNFEDDDYPTNHIPIGPSTIKYAQDLAQKITDPK
jgi:hypothetical protein